MKKIERNDPCPCGSGKKYKQCCLKRDESLATDKRNITASIPLLMKEAMAHHQSGRFSQADALYRQILQIEPKHADVLHWLGLIAYQTGKYELAIDLINQALKINSSNAAYYGNLGLVLQAQNKPEQALASFRKALSLSPNYVEAYFNLGNLLRDQHQLAEAVAHYLRSLALKPDFAEAHNNLGTAHKELGKLDLAVANCRQALALKPDFAEAHCNLGYLLQELGKQDAAIVHCRKALDIQPSLAEAHFNLGNALKEQGKSDEAVNCYCQALALKPDYAKAHYNLGNELKDMGKLDEAITHYQQALSYRPDYADAYGNLLFLHSYHASIAPHEYLALARKWEQNCLTTQERLSARQRVFRRAPLADRRLRVGYVSGDFRRHAVSYFIEQVFAHHNRMCIELFAYSTSGIQDEVTERLQTQVDHWVHILKDSDENVRKRIEADEIDVLIDLSGHTRHNRLGVFARRAAPVQACYLGYFASTGLTEMDYWIGDDILTPPATDCHFSERVWRLPRVWLSYNTISDAPSICWQPDSKGTLWLGSFNNLGKLTPQTFSLWARVLHALPEAKLLLKTRELADQCNRQRIVDTLAGLGVSADRIELQRDSSWKEYMSCYDQLDIALDPVGGHGGGTSTCDALWMGVPVIHALGHCATSRFTASMLSAIGRPEWIAQSEIEYIDKVVTLARDVKLRQSLRASQRQQMAGSSLCDARGLSKSLENAYLEMFERWQSL